MKKLGIFVLLCFLFNKELFNQTFSNRDRYDRASAVHFGLCVKDSFITTTGFISDTINPYSLLIYFATYSQSGALLNVKQYNISNSYHTAPTVNALEYDEQRKTYFTTGYTRSDSGKMKILFIEVDENLDLVRTREYFFTSRYLYGRKVIKSPDQGYYLLADVQEMSYSVNIALLKLDSSLNLMWLKKYGLPPSDIGESSTNLMFKNDTILISNISRRTGDLPNWVYNNIMIEWDTAGNFKSETFNPESQIGGAWDIGKYSSGGYYFCAGKCPFQTQSQAAGLGHIQRLDSAYNTIWSFNVGYPYYATMLRDIKETSDGSLISVGFYYNASTPYLDEKYHHYGWIVKASADGDSVWQRFYLGIERIGEQLERNELYDMELLDDGSIIACGAATDPNDTFPQQAWLLRLNANGCMDDGSCGYDPIPLSIDPVMEQLTIFKVYPNPIKDVCTVTLSSDCLGGVLQLTDFNGCELEEWRISSTQLQLKLNQHPPGTYLLHIIRDDGMKISKKVVVEGR